MPTSCLPPNVSCNHFTFIAQVSLHTRAKAFMVRGNQELYSVHHEHCRQISLMSYPLNYMIQAKLANTKEGNLDETQDPPVNDNESKIPESSSVWEILLSTAAV